MPKLVITKLHSLGKDEAKKRIDSLFVEEAFSGDAGSPTWAWNGYTAVINFTMYGRPFTGDLTVTDTEVDIVADIPLLALPFEGRVKTVIGDHLEKALANS